MQKLTEEQIAALPLSEKERKSNEAFAKLAAIIKYYNEGWEPTHEDKGWFVFSEKKLVEFGMLPYASCSGLICGDSFNGTILSFAYSGTRLAIRDLTLCKFIAENYGQLYRYFWMEN